MAGSAARVRETAGSYSRVFPVNVYQGQDRIMLAAPLPGLEPSNIHMYVDGRRITLAVDLRGPSQERAERYVQREWMTGPYSRGIDLPIWVDAAKANASYDNGVLVVILPIAGSGTSGTITMAKVGTSKGQAIGHVGHDLRALPDAAAPPAFPAE